MDADHQSSLVCFPHMHDELFPLVLFVSALLSLTLAVVIFFFCELVLWDLLISQVHIGPSIFGAHLRFTVIDSRSADAYSLLHFSSLTYNI